MISLNLTLPLTATTAVLYPDQLYDTLILGGGPAGYTAAIYLKRKGLKVGIISKKLGGQVTDTSTVENYTGFESISGEALAQAFKKHTDALEVPILDGYTIEQITEGAVKRVVVENGETYQAKTLLVATGSKPRLLDVPGEADFINRGVTYCAICDGPLYNGRKVVVAGGGNSAIEAALDLSKIVEQVTIIHRSQFRADPILLNKLYETPNITIHLETAIQEIYGDKQVKGVKAISKKTGEALDIEASGIFIEVGYTPNSQLFSELVQLNERGEIIINANNETTSPGIFAAGDVTDVPYKQIIIAAGEGAKAALAINDALNRG